MKYKVGDKIKIQANTREQGEHEVNPNAIYTIAEIHQIGTPAEYIMTKELKNKGFYLYRIKRINKVNYLPYWF